MAYFKWKGKDSRDFGISATLPAPPLSGRNVKSIEIPGRYTSIDQISAMRKNIQLTLPIGIDDLSKIDEINAWLQGTGELILCDDMNKKYHASISAAITPERLSHRLARYPIVFTCEPFRYAVFNPVNEYEVALNDENTETSVNIYCKGTAIHEPLLYFKLAGELEVTVNGAKNPLVITSPGHFTGDIATNPPIENITYYNYDYDEIEIYVDCSAKVAYTIEYDEKVVCTNLTKGIFPVLRHEDNFINLRLNRRVWNIGSKFIAHNQSLTKFKCKNNERFY